MVDFDGRDVYLHQYVWYFCGGLGVAKDFFLALRGSRLDIFVGKLGLFTVILNAGMVALTILILPDVSMTFWGAIGSCLVISLINFLVNLAVPDVK